jgi:predicted  nucleic acid-binding Zn-ribbon protein
MKALEHLQELDLKIDALKKKKGSIPAALKALEDSFNKTRQAVEAKKNAIGEIEKVQRQTKAALDLNNDRMTRANSKLEAVGNSQEYQAASKEIEQLKKLNLSLEEQMTKSAKDIEAGNQDLVGLNEAMIKAQGERDAQASALAGEGGKFDTEINALAAERDQYVSQVDKRILAQYDRVRVARGGLGLVPAVGGRCKGCNMMVPPQLYNEVQRGSNVQACPSCHRLLFVPNAGENSGDSARA